MYGIAPPIFEMAFLFGGVAGMCLECSISLYNRAVNASGRIAMPGLLNLMVTEWLATVVFLITAEWLSGPVQALSTMLFPGWGPGALRSAIEGALLLSLFFVTHVAAVSWRLQLRVRHAAGLSLIQFAIILPVGTCWCLITAARRGGI